MCGGEGERGVIVVVEEGAEGWWKQGGGEGIESSRPRRCTGSSGPNSINLCLHSSLHIHNEWQTK